MFAFPQSNILQTYLNSFNKHRHYTALSSPIQQSLATSSTHYISTQNVHRRSSNESLRPYE
jgi:hypothetical protein